MRKLRTIEMDRLTVQEFKQADKLPAGLPTKSGELFLSLSLLSATVQGRAVSRVVLSSLRVVTLAGRVVRERGGMVTPFARAAHGSRPAATDGGS